MAGKAAPIVDFQEDQEDPFRPPADVLRIETTDPVKEMLRLEIEKRPRRVEIAHLKQAQIAVEHREDPAVQAIFRTLGGSSNQEEGTDGPPLSVDDFLAAPHSEFPPAPVKKFASLADRSKWSPKLRKLIEERFPEEGKAERIRRAREKRQTVRLGEGLSWDELRYYAEDVDLEYDV